MKQVYSTIFSAILVGCLLGSTRADASDQTQQMININTATEAELTYLPGLGPSKAKAIVAYRTKRAFKKVEDILRVKGIGRKTFKTLRPYLRVSGETSIKSKVTVSKQ